MDTKLLTDLVGYTAAALGTCVFLPQVIKSWQTKRTKNVSFLSFLLLSIGAVLWVIYGLLINATPVFVVNGIILVLSMCMLILKRKYG